MFKLTTIAALALTLSAAAMANQTDDIVRSMAANDVPAFTVLLKSEVGKVGEGDAFHIDRTGGIDDNFYINPTGLEIYIQPRVPVELFGRQAGIDRARALGRSICAALSRSQHDRSFFLAWTVNVMAWVGKVGDESSGFDPVLKCKLGGER
jgi:hypothetical protein